jgi:hypothetical protein
MVSIVNREAERILIDDAFRALRNYKEDLLRIPIIDFYGVKGIGKTAILKYIEQKCKDQDICCILVDASQNADNLPEEIIRQVQQYNIHLTAHDENSLQLSQQATKMLLADGIAVMLLDAVDASNEELLGQIAAILHEVVNDNRFFVVITSGRNLLFDTSRAVARKLTPHLLKPFDQKSSEIYVNNISVGLEPDIVQSIFDWTHGYPLAIQVMTQAIVEQGLDPRLPEKQRPLLEIIVKKVIYDALLANIAVPQLQECLIALELFSIPRRFNLVIIQELIEHFDVQELKRDSSLSYMSLPRSINQNTDMLIWDMQRAGFSVVAPVRAIFILKSKLEQPERYLELHRFLAHLNKQFAESVHGTDRARYFREYLYHSAFTESTANTAKNVIYTIDQVIAEPPVALEQFFEEFLLDSELQEALGEQSKLVFSRIYQHWAQMNREAAHHVTGIEHTRHLQEYFYFIMADPLVADLSLKLHEGIQEVLAEEPSENIPNFVEEILRGEKLKAVAARQIELFKQILQEDITRRG